MSRSKNIVPEGFARRLHDLRRQKNLSQTELSQQVDLHYTHIGRYERGESRPSADTLKRLADALGVSGDYLLEGATTEAAKARFEDRDLLQHFQEAEQLPREDKDIIKAFLGAFLMRRRLERMVIAKGA